MLLRQAHREFGNLLTQFKHGGFKAAGKMLAEDVRFILSWRTAAARDNPFDREHSTDTGGTVPLFKLDIKSPNVKYGRHYTATPGQGVHNALKAIAEDFGEFTFVDLGCGKGRVLLVAADYGFKQLIGVEFAPQLAEIARSNCRELSRVRIEVEDASSFRFPAGKLVVYLFNPFGEPVMRPVIKNLLSHRETVWVAYYNPVCANLLDSETAFESQSSPSNTRIWKLSSGPTASKLQEGEDSAMAGGPVCFNPTTIVKA